MVDSVEDQRVLLILWIVLYQGGSQRKPDEPWSMAFHHFGWRNAAPLYPYSF